jgi:hypothetical protein
VWNSIQRIPNLREQDTHHTTGLSEQRFIPVVNSIASVPSTVDATVDSTADVIPTVPGTVVPDDPGDVDDPRTVDDPCMVEAEDPFVADPTAIN